MIYFDNAATGWPKPAGSSVAVCEALEKAGNPGRGAHAGAAWAAQKVYSVREKLAHLFHIDDPLQIAFTMNATHALNLAVNLCRGEIVTTSMDHNSVLRPVVSRGYFNIVKADDSGHIEASEVIRHITPMTGAVVMTHSSNVTGEIYDIETVGAACRKRGILFIVDCAQTAGVVPIDVCKMNIDVLCFPGHKGLLGPQGTGGIYIRKGIPLKPLMQGGTGSRSFQLTQPLDMPECFEAGTVNVHGIAGLGAGIDYINSIGIPNIYQKETELRRYFTNQMSKIVEQGDSPHGEICGKIYGRGDVPCIGTVSVNIQGMDSSHVASVLAEHDICVRGGFHCAPLAHRSLGTDKSGTVRFSFGYENTYEEIDRAVSVIRHILVK